MYHSQSKSSCYFQTQLMKHIIIHTRIFHNNKLEVHALRECYHSYSCYWSRLHRRLLTATGTYHRSTDLIFVGNRLTGWSLLLLIRENHLYCSQLGMSSTVAAGIQVSLVLLWQGGRILLLWLRRNCLCCFFWLNLILLFIMLLLQSWGKSCCCEEKQTLLLRERATGEEIFVAHVAEKMRDVDCWRAVSTASDNWSCRHDWGKQSLLLLTLLKQVIVSPRDCKGIAHSGWEEMLVMVEGWRLMLRRLRLSSCCPRWSQLLMKLVTVVACCGCFGRRYHWDCCGGLWWFEGYLWVYFRLERLKSKAVTVLAER